MHSGVGAQSLSRRTGPCEIHCRTHSCAVSSRESRPVSPAVLEVQKMSRAPRRSLLLTAALALTLLLPASVSASHSWGSYHWARTSNPFTLKLGNKVDSTWYPYLSTTSTDWSVAGVLDTAIVAGTAVK